MYIPIPIGMSNSLDLEGKEEKCQTDFLTPYHIGILIENRMLKSKHHAVKVIANLSIAHEWV